VRGGLMVNRGELCGGFVVTKIFQFFENIFLNSVGEG
jgi:hypothetical protein